MANVWTVGEILVEMMAAEVGQSLGRPGTFSGPYPSGAPAIFIDQVAKMGVSCGIIAAIGDDDFGRLNKERLAADGVDVAHVRTVPAFTTGTAFVTYYEDGSRQFIFHFPNSAAGQLSADDIDEESMKGASYLHIMGCSISATPCMRQAILRAVELAKSGGAKISFDPNIRPELLGERSIRQAFDHMLRAADILLTGDKEALLLTGEASIGDAVAHLLGLGIETIVLKKGAQGAELYKESFLKAIRPFAVKEVDPTGAGDCFDGAFIAALAGGKTPEEALLLASAAGALSVTIKGPMEGVASLDEITSLAYTCKDER